MCPIPPSHLVLDAGHSIIRVWVRVCPVAAEVMIGKGDPHPGPSQIDPMVSNGKWHRDQTKTTIPFSIGGVRSGRDW